MTLSVCAVCHQPKDDPAGPGCVCPVAEPVATVQGPSITRVTGFSGLRFHGVAHRTVQPMPQDLSPFEAYMLSLMDGVSPVDDVVAASGLSPLDAALALHRLKELSLVEFTPDPRGRPEAALPEAAVRLGTIAVHKQAAVVGRALPDVGADVAQVRQSWDAGDYPQARRTLQAVLAVAPDAPAVLAMEKALVGPHHAVHRCLRLAQMGRHAEQEQRPSQAVEFYERALVEYAYAPSVHFALATCLLGAGTASPAVQRHLELACQLDPTNAGYLELLERVVAQLNAPRRAPA